MTITMHNVVLKTTQPDLVTPLDGVWSLRVLTVGGTLINTETGGVAAGSRNQKTIAGVTTFVLPAIPQSGIDPSDATYQLVFEPAGRSGSITTAAFQLDDNKSLGDLTTESGLPITPSVLEEALAARDETLGYRDQAGVFRDEAAAFGGTNDTIIAGRLADEDSETRAVAASLYVGLKAPETAAVGGTDAVSEIADALADSDTTVVRLKDTALSYYIIENELVVPTGKALHLPHGTRFVPGGIDNVLAVEQDAHLTGGIIDVSGSSGYTGAAIILRGTATFGTSNVLTAIRNVRLKGKSGNTGGVHVGEGVGILLDTGTLGNNRISYAHFDDVHIRGFDTAVKLWARAKLSGTPTSLLWVNANTFKNLKISQPRRGIDIIREGTSSATANEFDYQLQSSVGIESGFYDQGRGNIARGTHWDWADPTIVSGTVTFDGASNVVTLTTPDASLVAGRFVRFDNFAGTPGIVKGVTYRVLAKLTDSTFTLAATGGGPILDLGDGTAAGMLWSTMAFESVVLTETSSEVDHRFNEARRRIRNRGADNDNLTNSVAARTGTRVIGRVGAVANPAKYGDQDDWLAYAPQRGIAVTQTAGAGPSAGTVANMFDPKASSTALWSGLISTGAVTFTDVGDLVATPTAHGRAVGDKVQFATVFDSTGITNTTGVAARTWYYVKTTPTATTLTLSATPGGATLPVTADGTGDGFSLVDIGPFTHEIDWTTSQNPLTIGAAFANGNNATAVTLEVYKGTTWRTIYDTTGNNADTVEQAPADPNTSAITKLRWTFAGISLGETAIEVERLWMFEAKEPGKAYTPSNATRLVRKTATTTRNNTNTPAADPDLTMTVEANAVYEVTGLLHYDATTNADTKWSWSVPAGSSLTWGIAGAQPSATVNTSAGANLTGYVSATSTHQLGGTGAGQRLVAQIRGLLVVGSTAGSITLNWSQFLQEVSDVNLFAGSYLKLARIS